MEAENKKKIRDALRKNRPLVAKLLSRESMRENHLEWLLCKQHAKNSMMKIQQDPDRLVKRDLPKKMYMKKRRWHDRHLAW